MTTKELEQQIRLLEKRVEELERRPQYIPYPALPTYPTYPTFPTYPSIT